MLKNRLKKKLYLFIFILNRCKKKFSLGWFIKCQKDFKRLNILLFIVKFMIYFNVYVYVICFYFLMKNIQVLCIYFVIYCKYGFFLESV